MKKDSFSSFSFKDAREIFANLSEDYRVLAPVVVKDSSRFSSADLVTYSEVNSFDDIEFNEQTYYSAKSEVFPIRETLFEISDEKVKTTKLNQKPAIVLMRSCDIHALQIMDMHFLSSSDKSDSYYEIRRKNIKVFLIECTESFENCFCVSLGSNKTEDYSAFIRKTPIGFELSIRDETIIKYFPSSDKDISLPVFQEKNLKKIPIIDDIPNSVFQNEIWKEYSQRCIACGRCNTVCPTCTCFTVQDLVSKNEKDFERRRIWSSCHIKKFSILAGGHDFRTENGDRMRYKTLHKIQDFRKRHNKNMCTGCGRCDNVCPEYISIFNCIDKINKILRNDKSE